MRKQLINVLTSWEQGKKNEKYDAIWTNGEDIYSYGTILYERERNLLNSTKYSKTTTIYQNGLRVYFANAKEVEDIPRGTRRLNENM